MHITPETVLQRLNSTRREQGPQRKAARAIDGAGISGRIAAAVPPSRSLLREI